jgi:ATP phosphoribosyltransferase regulatory subunit
LDDLAASWRIIEAMGLAARVRVDFSVMSAFDYYTGLVLEVYAPGAGVALGSGGRYDGMLSAFGAAAPAAGFAFSLEKVMEALVVQGAGDKRNATAPVRLPVVGDDPVKAFREAGELRALGLPVILDMATGTERSECSEVTR